VCQSGDSVRVKSSDSATAGSGNPEQPWPLSHFGSVRILRLDKIIKVLQNFSYSLRIYRTRSDPASPSTDTGGFFFRDKAAGVLPLNPSSAEVKDEGTYTSIASWSAHGQFYIYLHNTP
jgi:hypothetical protein